MVSDSRRLSSPDSTEMLFFRHYHPGEPSRLRFDVECFSELPHLGARLSKRVFTQASQNVVPGVSKVTVFMSAIERPI